MPFCKIKSGFLVKKIGGAGGDGGICETKSALFRLVVKSQMTQREHNRYRILEPLTRETNLVPFSTMPFL